MATTLEQAPRDGTRWSTRGLAQALGMSQTTVSCIWRAFGMQPHHSGEFRHFLDTVDATTPPGLDLRLILANAATHRTELIKR